MNLYISKAEISEAESELRNQLTTGRDKADYPVNRYITSVSVYTEESFDYRGTLYDCVTGNNYWTTLGDSSKKDFFKVVVELETENVEAVDDI